MNNNEKTYNLVFRGEVLEGFDTASAKSSFNNLLYQNKLNDQQLNQAFSGAHISIVKNISWEKASGLKQKLSGIGLKTEIVETEESQSNSFFKKEEQSEPAQGKSSRTDNSDAQSVTNSHEFSDFDNESNNYKKVFFIPKMLEKISSGKFLTTMIGRFLQVQALLVVICSLVFTVYVWKFVGILFEMVDMGGDGSYIFRGVLVGLVVQVFLILLTYMIVHISLVRAKDIMKIGNAPFFVLRSISVLCKYNAEVYASAAAIVITGVGIISLLLGELFSQFPIEAFGASGIIVGPIIAIAILIFGYLLSELVLILIHIADDVSTMKHHTVSKPDLIADDINAESFVSSL